MFFAFCVFNSVFIGDCLPATCCQKCKAFRWTSTPYLTKRHSVHCKQVLLLNNDCCCRPHSLLPAMFVDVSDAWVCHHRQPTQASTICHEWACLACLTEFWCSRVVNTDLRKWKIGNNKSFRRSEKQSNPNCFDLFTLLCGTQISMNCTFFTVSNLSQISQLN